MNTLQVKALQSRLKELGCYTGNVDGLFGPKTQAAVTQFQAGVEPVADGVVRESTWQRLFTEKVTVGELVDPSLGFRCLSLTASFETGKLPPDCFGEVAGDFDGQGISFGALQWNLGQRTLQPLLTEMFRKHERICRDIFGEHFVEITNLADRPVAAHLAFARSIQNLSNFRVREPWRTMLQQLGQTRELQEIQAAHAAKLQARSRTMCHEYGLTTERGAALMFDICVQNGSITSSVRAQIMHDFGKLHNPDDQVARMQIIANRRSAASKPQFVDNVRHRKMTIANGEGVVHGIRYNLEKQFGLTLQAIL